MEWLNLPLKIGDIFRKYKYIFLVIAVGAVLMLWPSSKAGDESVNTEKAADVTVVSTEKQLENILSKIKGVGRVSVMLTTAKGEEVLFKSDLDISEGQTREDTIILTDADRAQNGLITQVNPPIYLGAIIVCDGAEDPVVRLAVVNAVRNATGLGADSISVLKMN